MAEFERGNLAALTHGSTSPRQIRPVARNHRRRVLRQLQLSPKQLDPVGLAHLDAYVQLRAKIDLIDAHVAKVGVLRANGEVEPAMKVYVALQNSARLALQRLSEHLQRRGIADPLDETMSEGRLLRLADAEKRAAS